MNLYHILREIRNLNYYSNDEWDEYLTYFQNDCNFNSDLINQPDYYDVMNPDSIFNRIKSKKEHITPSSDLQSSCKVKRIEDFSEAGFRKEITLGIVSGCYDLLHLNHIRGIKYAKLFMGKNVNSKLCVLLLSDENIKHKKGIGRPVLNLNERLELVCAVPFVDFVITLREPDCIHSLEKLKPEFYYKSETDLLHEIVNREINLVQSHGGKLVSFPEFAGRNISTTNIIELAVKN